MPAALEPALAACPIVRTASDLGDRWTLLVLREAAFGTSRFTDLRRRLHIASDVLADRLRDLVDAGLLERSAYRAVGERTRDAYRLTPSGRDFQLVLGALGAWGAAHRPTDEPGVSAFRDAAGGRLHVAFVDERGQEVPARAAEAGFPPRP